MEHFSEEHSKVLLGKEWLVKVDQQHSTAYLIKFHAAVENSSCCMLVTDTRNTWAEVLTRNQLARRWRDCNHVVGEPLLAGEEEHSWRKRKLELLDQAHTLGGIKDLSFVVVDPRYGDFAFELEGDSIKWRWEAVSLGHKLSSEILSKHLIMPLISVTHLAFASADPVSELSEPDLEKAVDKMGRAARRILETHIKHAISKPRVATTVQRMTALINFVPELPAIASIAEPPKIQSDVLSSRPTSFVPSLARSASPPIPVESNVSAVIRAPAMPEPDSATESESDNIDKGKDKGKDKEKENTPLRDSSSNNAARSVPQTKGMNSDSDSSPTRPPKQNKRPASSSDDDSEAERRRRVTMLKSGASAVKRGTKQPIKRGGKRF